MQSTQKVDQKKILGDINNVRRKAREEFLLEIENILDEAREIINVENKH